MVAKPVGLVLTVMGATQGLSAAVAEIAHVLGKERRPIDEGAALWMLLCMALTMGAGLGMYAYGRRAPSQALKRREATLVVAGIWLAISIFGALPLVVDSGLSYTDAFFEAVSGFTTTGATIVGNIEGTLSTPVLVWRSAMQWLGGMGIVVLFVAVFPNVGVGAKHLFQYEAPGPPSAGLQPRIAETSMVLWRLYLFFTLVEIAVLMALGMDGFNALCHSFTTMSTGGFSTLDSSVGGFDSAAIETVIAVFMIIAGVNFSLYYSALRGRSFRPFLKSTEFKVYFGLVVITTALLTWHIRGVHDNDLLQALRYAFFMVATTITSTGYGTDDYMAYPGPGLFLVLFLMFVGGSAGSTAGGIKVARVAVLTKNAWAQVRQAFRPNLVQVVRFDGRAAPERILAEAGAFIVLFFICLAAGTFIVSWTDHIPVEAAFGAMLSCFSNMGPGPFHVTEADNFAAYTDVAKLLFSLAMILGRLEFFTLLALLVPDFWRRG
ncbi:MAG: TrkH family potassium uptake protein [Deltaproteobacteria bacterium]|nr:MAG: TrkH family potassium uptake protein [Deltaproteobacteria bacterium]